MQTKPSETRRRQCWPWLVTVVWLAAVVTGLVLVWKYANTAARAEEPRSQWPGNSQISLDSSFPTLIMFVHPHCPCTRASVAELARISARCAGRFHGWVVLLKPTETEDGWEQTDLKASAEDVPGIQVVNDTDGKLARLFHATTSGYTLLYGPAGELLFSGGITAARGHEGDNAGESAIVSLLTGEATERSRSPVFGCPIFEGE